jgi:hypothetical protein
LSKCCQKKTSVPNVKKTRTCLTPETALNRSFSGVFPALYVRVLLFHNTATPYRCHEVFPSTANLIRSIDLKFKFSGYPEEIINLWLEKLVDAAEMLAQSLNV